MYSNRVYTLLVYFKNRGSSSHILRPIFSLIPLLWYCHEEVGTSTYGIILSMFEPTAPGRLQKWFGNSCLSSGGDLRHFVRYRTYSPWSFRYRYAGEGQMILSTVLGSPHSGYRITTYRIIHKLKEGYRKIYYICIPTLALFIAPFLSSYLNYIPWNFFNRFSTEWSYHFVQYFSIIANIFQSLIWS